ncbi:hypothetical protein JTE90_029276 [Oedothorax gibbosus]|uniref:Peptidase M12B propeptide domain-containing protein n=1 Tax=Oedothorax gibbosus TaxID=931172 RepID=A0AAV6U683_9ARAC|nr:hypothetical protein JTE90_029276 [Oedothorax gibbosus]
MIETFASGEPEANSRTTVHPLRIDFQGRPFPQQLQFRKKGQSSWYSKTIYRFEGLNRTWILELEPRHAVHVEKLDINEFIQSGCYYKGHVRGEKLSSVEVNICGGMTGDIHLSQGDYVIHPLTSNTSSFHPHHLSNLHYPDPTRKYKPLLAEDINYCDVKAQLSAALGRKDLTTYSQSSWLVIVTLAIFFALDFSKAQDLRFLNGRELGRS